MINRDRDRERALEDALLEGRECDLQKGLELELRFAARGPTGRVGFRHTHRQLVAGAISFAILIGVFGVILALCRRYHGSIGISFWPYAFVYRRVLGRVPMGRVTADGIEVVGASGVRTISYDEIVDVGGEVPHEHFGVPLTLTRGERVFLEVGFVDALAPYATPEALEEWTAKATPPPCARLAARALDSARARGREALGGAPRLRRLTGTRRDPHGDPATASQSVA